MAELLVVVAVLACPVSMVVMMLVMMRGHRHSEGSPDSVDREVGRLRAEVSALRRRIQEAAGDTATRRS